MPGFKSLMTLGATLLDQVGDRNPQLLRELRGNLKTAPVAIALVLTLLIQGSILVGFWLSLPGSVQENHWFMGTYPQIEWEWLGYNPEGSAEAAPASSDAASAPLANSDNIVFRPHVQSVHLYEPVKGQKAPGDEAVNQLRPGDRLIAINGIDLMDLEGSDLALGSRNAYDAEHALSGPMDEQLYGVHRERQWSEPLNDLFDTAPSLTLKRSGGETFTVSLSRVAIVSYQSIYCQESLGNARGCDVSPDLRHYLINWTQWYSDLFHVLAIALGFVTMIGGTFLLGQNLAHERRRGTLNFLRLSPRSCVTLFSGKLLGVPILLYGAIAITLPLLCFAGLQAGLSLGHLLAFIFILMVQSLVFYLLAIVVSVLSPGGLMLGFQPWLVTAGVGFFHWIALVVIGSGFGFERSDTNALIWTLLFSPFTSLAYVTTPYSLFSVANSNLALGLFRINLAEYLVLVVLNALGWGALLGHCLQRRFSTFNRTLLARRFSYPLTLIFSFVVLGLSQPSRTNDYAHIPIAVFLGVLYFMTLAIALSPDRQSLMDWARIRDTQAVRTRRSLVMEWLIEDASSPVGAIALNLLIGTALFWIWFEVSYGDLPIPPGLFVAALGLFIGSILVAVMAVQTVMMMPRKKNWIWFSVIGTIAGVVFPVSSLLIYGVFQTRSPAITTLLGLSADLASLVIPLMGLSTVMAILTIVHSRQLKVAGRSESQALFQPPRLT